MIEEKEIKEIEINLLTEGNKIGEVKNALLELIEGVEKEYKKITFLCIGTDKVIVDSVGPLVGSNIDKKLCNVEVLGELEKNVHALNLEETALTIDGEENLVIAIDACMSEKKEKGTVVIANKPLLPGKGLGKYLGEYGDISIKVIVSDDYDDFFRSTSLGFVLKISNIVSDGINEALKEISLREQGIAVSDPYMNETMVLDRLRREYKRYRKLIIAYDFDYTINNYRNENWEYSEVIKLLRDWKEHAYFICYTASNKERYEEIRNKTKEIRVPLDYINENAKGVNVPEGGKIYYNILLDDRSGLGECVKVLRKLITEIIE